MRQNFSLAALVLGLALCFAGTFSAGAGVYYSDNHFSFGYDIYPEKNTNDGTSVQSYLRLDDGTIQQVSVSGYGPRGRFDPKTGEYVTVPNGAWANLWFYGIKTPPTTIGAEFGQNLAIDRGDVKLSEGVSSFVYDYNAGGEKGMVPTDAAIHLMSYGSAYFNGSFTVDGTVQANYGENIYQDEVDGVITTKISFYASVQIPIIWNDGVSIGEVPMISASAPVAVPEPASLSVLFASVLGLLARRRHSK